MLSPGSPIQMCTDVVRPFNFNLKLKKERGAQVFRHITFTQYSSAALHRQELNDFDFACFFVLILKSEIIQI